MSAQLKEVMKSKGPVKGRVEEFPQSLLVFFA